MITTFDEPVFTTEVVFGKTCQLLNEERAAISVRVRMVSEQRLNPLPLWSDHGARAAALLSKYPRRDAGDTSLAVLSELHLKAKIVPTDVRDITVYRRFRNEAPPLIRP